MENELNLSRDFVVEDISMQFQPKNEQFSGMCSFSGDGHILGKVFDLAASCDLFGSLADMTNDLVDNLNRQKAQKRHKELMEQLQQGVQARPGQSSSGQAEKVSPRWE